MINVKNCARCKIKKSLNKFYPDKRTKDKKRFWCIDCDNKASDKFCNKYPWKTRLYSIKQRCNNPKCKAYKWYGGRGIKCLITSEEIKELWFRDKAYKMKRPSIDRKENNKDYIFENCRFIELSKNSSRQDKTDQEKPVNQYDLEGNFIRSFKSVMESERILCIKDGHGHIVAVCLGKRKTAYRYKWLYKE